MSQELFIAWRAGGAAQGRWGPVGRLRRVAHGYRFVYTRGARALEGFCPFPDMPRLDAVYESEDLFPLFANRLLARSRPEYEAYLTWSGFDPQDPPDPIALLGVTEGMRQTDSLELFPLPQPDADGCYSTRFFLHGLRWMPEVAQARATRLESGEPLGLTLQPLVSGSKMQAVVPARSTSYRAIARCGTLMTINTAARAATEAGPAATIDPRGRRPLPAPDWSHRAIRQASTMAAAR